MTFHFLKDLLISVAEAQSAPATAAPRLGQTQGPGSILWPVLLSFGVIYFFMMRPQQKKEQEHRKRLTEIEKGDEVVTKGGLMGKVTNVADKILTVEIAEKIRVRIDREFILSINKTEKAS